MGFYPPGAPAPYIPAPVPPASVLAPPSPQPPVVGQAPIKLSNGVTIQWAQPPANQPSSPPSTTLSNGVQIQWNQPGQETVSAPGEGDAVSGAMGAQSGPLMPIDDPSKLPNVSATAAASFPKNPAAKAQYLAQSIFPDLPPDQAIKRMGFDGDRYYYIANDGKAYYAEPKMAPISDPKTSALESVDWLASGLGPSLPTIGGMAGGVLGGPEPASVVPAFGGAMLGDALRQTGARVFTGELQGEGPGWPIVRDFTGPGTVQAIGQGAEAAIGQAAGLGLAKGVSLLIDRNPLRVQFYDVKGLTPARVQEIQNNVDLAQSMGVDVTPGEAGKVRSLLANQRQLLRQPEAMTTLGDFYDMRNTQQIPNAFQDVLDRISLEPNSAVANRDFGAAAGATIKGSIQARQAASQGLYTQAFAANPAVKTADIDQILTTDAGKQALTGLASDLRNNRAFMASPDGPAQLKTINAIVGSNSGDISSLPGLSMNVLDMVKQKLWDIEQAAKGENGAATFSSRNIGNLRTDLANELDSADASATRDPSTGAVTAPGFYSQARSMFEANSPPVTSLQKGIVGLVAKPKATGLQNLPKMMFSAQTSDPFSIAQAKAAYAKAGQTDQWNAGVRSFLQNTFDDATAAGARSDAGPAKPFWDTISGNPRQIANLKAALGPTQFTALDDFMKVAKMVRNGVKYAGEGSPTATDIGVRGKMAGPMAKGIGGVLGGLDVFTIPTDLKAKIIDRSAGKNFGKLADLITNPQATATLRRLRVLSPGSKQWIQQLGYLGSIIGGNTAATGIGYGIQGPIPVGQVSGPGATQ